MKYFVAPILSFFIVIFMISTNCFSASQPVYKVTSQQPVTKEFKQVAQWYKAFLDNDFDMFESLAREGKIVNIYEGEKVFVLDRQLSTVMKK